MPKARQSGGRALSRSVRGRGATPEELRPILDAFRAPGVSFLTPYAPEPIDDKTPIDISHEALIRCWRKIGLTRTAGF